VGLGFNFAFFWPSCGHQVFSNIYLVVVKCFPLLTWWPPSVLLHILNGCQVVIYVFSILFLTEFLIKIILPYFGYQLNSCILCVGLTFPMTRMEAFTHSWISFCLTFLLFGRCMMFIFLMQWRGFKLFDLKLTQLKSSSFSMSMVSFITFQSLPFFKGINKRLGKT
jgi:hypothetical protein